MPPPPQYIKEKQVSDFLDGLRGNVERLLDFELMIEWSLRSKPTHFPTVDSTDFRLWKMQKRFAEFPALELLYRFDEVANVVTVVRVRELREED